MQDTVEVFVKATGRTFVLRELNGLNSTNADAAAREPIAVISYRSAMAIQSINGVPEPPAMNSVDLESRLQRLSGRELRVISEKYATAFGLTDDDLKNESTPGDSAPN